MVERQVVVLVVRGSSPFTHPMFKFNVIRFNYIRLTRFWEKKKFQNNAFRLKLLQVNFGLYTFRAAPSNLIINNLYKSSATIPSPIYSVFLWTQDLLRPHSVVSRNQFQHNKPLRRWYFSPGILLNIFGIVSRNSIAKRVPWKLLKLTLHSFAKGACFIHARPLTGQVRGILELFKGPEKVIFISTGPTRFVTRRRRIKKWVRKKYFNLAWW